MDGGMFYAFDGHVNRLKPDFRWQVSRIWIVGAEMYDMKGEYLGYWYRKSMPIALINLLRAYVRSHVKAETTYDAKGKKTVRKKLVR